MALFDNIGGLLGDLGIGVPRNTGIINDSADIDAINKRALTSGLINAGLTYLATPKNLNAGSPLPYLGRAALAGFGASQNTVDQALNTAYRNKILANRDDNLYNVDGALVDKSGKVIYQSPTKQQKRDTAVVDGVVVDVNTGEPIYTSPKQQKLNTDIIDVGGKKILINKDTGAPIQEYKVTGGGLGLKDIYGEPQKDENGKLVYIPKIPGYPVRDMGGNVIQGDVKLPEKAGEKLTEGERTAGFLSERLNNSLNQLKQVTGQQPSAASPNVKAEAIKFFTRSDYLKNLANPQSRQQVEAAQYDILDSALTLGTGAAYTREQLESYRQSYFPQLGDKPKTVEDKAKRLENLLEAAYKKAGRAAPKEAQPQPSMTMPATQGWSIKKKTGG
jgi:hypothetical protein